MADIASLLRDRLPLLRMAFDGDPGYDRMRATWNVRHRFRPLGLVAPRTAAEVSTIVTCAEEAGVDQLTIRSGGHSIEGNSFGGPEDRPLVIDLVEMNDVVVDPVQGTAIAEPGVLLGKLYYETWRNGGWMVPAGDGLSVGVGGQVTCGGYGRAARKYGNLTDRALWMEVVTADGRILKADNDNHADLFWALRGSGTGSFGVITKVGFRMNKAPQAPAHFSLRYRIADIDFEQTYRAVHDYCMDSPVEFSPILVVWRGIIELSGALWTETPEERTALIDEMRTRLPRPTESDIVPMSYLEVLERQSVEQTQTHWLDDASAVQRDADEYLHYNKIRALFLPAGLSLDCIRELGELARRQPRGARYQLVRLNPDTEQPAGSTAIKARGCAWMAGFGSDVAHGATDDLDEMIRMGDQITNGWQRQAYELLRPYSIGGYIGDDDLREADYGDLYDSYYGRYFPRLQQIKAKYDPDNIFRNQMSIPLARD
ncbi:FAD-binding oxidoreductase [Nocardia colli]|uniref:FAD-binding oxidoreductase n=1 Tax=Nocardia colli TaxID=2545717 RepID=A0A5N0EPS1_9NOCA|nr:FAD-binding oxidoreductase [Nocardia colli]KAA8889471.1 FAD-binding oxidoreductase [Nocardia colli]